MKRLTLMMLMTLAISQIAKGQCTPAAANIYAFTYNNTRYEVVKENLSWINAAACAVSRGGKLAEINSQAEQDALFLNINNAGVNAANTVAPDGGGASYLWIGGNDIATEGKWVWDGDNNGASTQFWQGTKATGSVVGGLYNNWGNEPDNWTSQNGLGFAVTNWPLGQAGQWNDVKEANQLHYVIEYPKTTSVTTINSNTISVYPNPAGAYITVAFIDAFNDHQLEISNPLGQVLLRKTISRQQTLIDLSGLGDNGIYFLQIMDQRGKKVHSQKVVKQ